MSLCVYWLNCSMCNAFQWNYFNLVDTCNIAIILFLKCDVTKFRIPPLLVTLRPPPPLNVWRNLWMHPNCPSQETDETSTPNKTCWECRVNDERPKGKKNTVEWDEGGKIGNKYKLIFTEESNDWRRVAEYDGSELCNMGCQCAGERRTAVALQFIY